MGMSKKNKCKGKVKQAKRQDNRLVQAFINGAKSSNKCSIESFKAIAETTKRKTMTIEEVILFLELTQDHLEENFKNRG
jgi:hypothetical protein